ncbi:MAG: YeeE/YedE family protein [Kofleriaceae bacterium]|nr:YeeE/YedE family protein [Kofleriaceae bacterium]
MRKRSSWIGALAAGALFGLGLALSGMTQPARVIAFLDPRGGWDPSLAFVMGGAMSVYALAYHLIVRRRRDPWLDVRFHLPVQRALDLPLVAGAALFGIGWGLAGYCPGPAVVSAASGRAEAILFVIAMLLGMLARDLRARRDPRPLHGTRVP